jgi:hypothetical protein
VLCGIWNSNGRSTAVLKELPMKLRQIVKQDFGSRYRLRVFENQFIE